MGVSGDFDKLGQLRARIRELTSAGFRQELAAELGRTTMKLVADEFRGERDPYADPWTPLARQRARDRRAAARAGKKSRGGKILRNTGRMAASVNYQLTSSGFRVNIPVSYASVHQNGATIAARSSVRGQTLWHDPDTGRLVGKGTKLSAVYETEVKPTTFGEVVIPQRMMLPSGERGLGPVYVDAYNRAAATMLRLKLKAAA